MILSSMARRLPKILTMPTVSATALAAGSDLLKAQTRYSRVSLAVLLAMSGASYEVIAQEAPAPNAQTTEGPSALEAVVVTGSRIIRDGYDSPTPLSVVGSEVLERSAASNVADVLRSIPVFAGSATPQSSSTSVSAQNAGLNLLNLRSMGSTRTLVLIDGQRSVGARVDGVVDINTIPQQLVQRVDIVTGGASAIYGSDAVTGVVNFVLDKNFTGFKAEASGGLTTYGDDGNYKIAMTAGTGFANDRGHFLISGELNDKDGVLDNHRPWNLSQLGIIQNTAANVAAGQPGRLVRYGVDSWFARGGTIDSGPLKGITFGQGGTPYQFRFGSITDSVYTLGGDSALGTIRNDTGTLDPKERRESVFTRLSYDLTDRINVFAQFSRNNAHNSNWAFSHFMLGNGPTVLSGNPFIPASVQSQMTALGLASIDVSGMNYDLPFIGPQLDRRTTRYVVGGSGSFELGTEWKWNAYYQEGVTLVSYSARGATRKALREQAVDAVIDPNSGSVVCRSTLTNPNDGCVPYNPMGLGVNSPAAINFISDGGQHPHTDQRITQEVADVSLSGDPFSTWAGPVSVAFNLEHRIESAVARPSQATLAGDWFSGNFFPFNGRFSVMEGAVETVIPLAKDLPFAESWDLSGAVRETDYSTSGRVMTWKIGTSWSPISDIRLRATRSRDIRAPNLQDLYNVVSGGYQLAFDPVRNSTAAIFATTRGNPDLSPETAKSTELGVVFTPRFLPGFSASIDYWNIDLSNAIVSPRLNDILLFCAQGLQSYCNDITRENGIVTSATQRPVNIAIQTTRGIDFEASYGFDLDTLNPKLSGRVGLHGQATKYLKNYSDTTLAPATDNVGEMGGSAPPDWSLVSRVDYTANNWNTAFTFRAMSSGVLNNTWIQCSSNCPQVSAPYYTVDDNHAPGYFYVDWSVAHSFDLGDTELETFFNINNVFNRDPGMIPKGSDEIGYEVSLSNPSKYDVLGRMFRVGFRLKM